MDTPESLTNPSDWLLERIDFICNAIERRYARKMPRITKLQGIAAKRANRQQPTKKKRLSEGFIVNTFLQADIDQQLQILGQSQNSVEVLENNNTLIRSAGLKQSKRKR